MLMIFLFAGEWTTRNGNHPVPSKFAPKEPSYVEAPTVRRVFRDVWQALFIWNPLHRRTLM
jgi:hypothetical protein